MIVGVQDVYYSVTDVKKAVNFYTEALQMKVLFQSEHWISLDCHGVKIGLHPESRVIPVIPRDAHGAHAGATLTLKSNNIKEDRERLEKHGAKILGEADQPWGHLLVFEDPDGNVLKLMNPKY